MVKEDFQLDYILGDPGANSRGEGKSEDDQIAERKGIGEEVLVSVTYKANTLPLFCIPLR